MTTLLSPLFDLSHSGPATLSYALWYSNNAGASPNADSLIVSVSSNGGANWSNLDTVGPAGEDLKKQAGGVLKGLFEN